MLTKTKLAALVPGAAAWVGGPDFYTTTGSRPTEIKGSYARVREGLSRIGVDLVWVSDGKGHREMVNSLRDAFIIFPNIYNLNQLRRNFADDLAELLRRT